MSRATTVYLDVTSPLNRYFDLLHLATYWLPRFVERDAEALRLVRMGQDRNGGYKERRYWDRCRMQQTGKTVCTPRIWTRCDKRLVRLELGQASGWYPARRTDRLADRLSRLHESCFRAAVEEVCRDDRIAVLGTKLESVKHAFTCMVDLARSVARYGADRESLDMAIRKIEEVLAELFDWLKPSAEPATGYTDPAMEQRDRWIYDKRKSGVGPAQLITQLSEVFADRDWGHITTDEGIRKAVNRYIKRTGAEDFRK